ncbi:hypothetical protein DL96DRAFT_1236372 [Flagelloscypha sp. PMI_526]|nr:hypothetical protein DL96DRAFT_1236372 [Flagelloscypha sp. PMI_526]
MSESSGQCTLPHIPTLPSMRANIDLSQPQNRETIRCALHETQGYKDSCTDVISFLEALLVQAKSVRTSYEKDIALFNSRLDFTWDLPPEVLSSIFEYAVQRNGHFGSPASILRLASVDTRWRTIALGNPALWTRIDIVLRPGTVVQRLPFVETFFRRAIGREVSLKLAPSYRFHPRHSDSAEFVNGCRELLLAASAHASQWAHVWLKLPAAAYSPCFPLQSLPKLCSLHLDCIAAHSVDIPPIGSDIPLLKTLSLGSYPELGQNTLPWTQILHLTVNAEDQVIPPTLDSLSWMVNLEEYCIISDTADDVAKQRRNPGQRVHLPKLRRLQSRVCWDHNTPENSWIGGIVAPNLTTLDIGRGNAPGNYFRRHLEQSKKLVSLGIPLRLEDLGNLQHFTRSSVEHLRLYVTFDGCLLGPSHPGTFSWDLICMARAFPHIETLTIFTSFLESDGMTLDTGWLPRSSLQARYVAGGLSAFCKAARSKQVVNLPALRCVNLRCWWDGGDGADGKFLLCGALGTLDAMLTIEVLNK